MDFLFLILLFCGTALFIVPLAKKLGLGSVLGYLISGVLIGPSGLSLIGNTEKILHFAEFGIVLLLFIIGLELQPKRLWAMRKPIFLLGTAQVLISAVFLTLLFYYFISYLGFTFIVSFVVGLILALSSTAFALQVLAERNLMATSIGQNGFSILLFQDIAVIPLLALLPLLSQQSHADFSWWSIFIAIIVVGAVILASRILVRPFLKLVLASNVRELMYAAALFLVIGLGFLMESIGLSMSLGAFLAGVLLADSEYCHELEISIQPFRGLLMGLFFIAVGMNVNLSLLFSEPLLILSLTFGMMLVKALCLFPLAYYYGMHKKDARQLCIILCQAGEFAFVLLTVALSESLVSSELAEYLVLMVSLSMAFTPLLLLINDYCSKSSSNSEEPEYETIEDHRSRVIIAGFGRFGQVIGRILRVKSIPFIALESRFEQIDIIRRYGGRIYFGDATRSETLQSAGAAHADMIVVAIHDVEESIRTVKTVKQFYPNLKIYARARNRQHAHILIDLGVDYFIRDTFLSSLEMTTEVLEGLGLPTEEAEKVTSLFRQYDLERLKKEHEFHKDEGKYINSRKKASEQFEELLKDDHHNIVK